MIQPGEPAPDFSLRNQDGEKVTLEDLKDQTSVLVFYPLDFSPVCTDQLNIYQELLPELEQRGLSSTACRWTRPSRTRRSRNTLA